MPATKAAAYSCRVCKRPSKARAGHASCLKKVKVKRQKSVARAGRVVFSPGKEWGRTKRAVRKRVARGLAGGLAGVSVTAGGWVRRQRPTWVDPASTGGRRVSFGRDGVTVVPWWVDR